MTKSVLRQITPDAKERAQVDRLAAFLIDRICAAAQRGFEDVEVRLDGSVAKDTWLSGEADIDIFLRVPPDKPRSFLESECLQVARRALKGYRVIERFAEHPYVESSVNGLRVNIVPCYRVEKGQWLSATDRTPYHTEYMKLHLSDALRNEVRLLKKILKVAELYGAEVKVKGFSGFLCEVLTLFYGSFFNVLEASSNWQAHHVIDVEAWYKDRKGDIPTLFNDPLVVVDPVDKVRNVASAVSPQSLWEFVSLSREFLGKPHRRFFTPPGDSCRLAATRRRMARTQSDLLILHIGKVDAVIDVIWSQLYKTERVLKDLLRKQGFNVLRSKAWSDEVGDCALIFELEDLQMKDLLLHAGPPVSMKTSSERFLTKHVDAPDTLAGPWVEGNRWMTKKKRKYTDAVQLLKDALSGGGSKIGVPHRISTRLGRRYRILVNDQALDLCRSSSSFHTALVRLLEGRPVWLAGKD